MRILAPNTCRPFAKGRKSLVLGEGAAILILERSAQAEVCGTPILAEMIGFGMSADATDIVQPLLEGATSAMRACIADSGLAPTAFEYVNADGSGTTMDDIIESRAIHEVSGAMSPPLRATLTVFSMSHGNSLSRWRYPILSLLEGSTPCWL